MNVRSVESAEVADILTNSYESNSSVEALIDVSSSRHDNIKSFKRLNILV